MKREDLKKLELSDEAIEQVMALHGKDVEAQKEKLASLERERDTVKTQLMEANQQIEGFKALDIEGVKRSAEEYKAKFEQAEAKAKTDLEQLRFDQAIDSALTGSKAKSAKAVRALLDEGALKLTDSGEMIGLKEQLEKIKTENDYLFDSDEKPPRIVGKSANHKADNDSGTFYDAIKESISLKE